MTDINDGLSSLISGLGGDKDRTNYLQFEATTNTQAQFDNAYRNWLMRKCVDIPIDDAFRKSRYITVDSEKVDTKAFYSFEESIGLKSKLIEAAKLARLYGGALVLIGTEDPNWNEPINERSKLSHLLVLSRYDVTRVEVNKASIKDPNYKQPEYFYIGGVAIHHSRVLRFDGDALPRTAWESNGSWHDSIVNRLSDVVKPACAAIQHSANILEMVSVDVFKTPDFFAKLASQGEESAMIKRFALASQMRSNLNMLVLDTREEYIRTAGNISGLPEIMLTHLRAVSAAADIPATRLLGQSASGLNATGEGDERNYNDSIASWQSSVLAARYAQIDPLICRVVYGTIPEGFANHFEPLRQMTELETADLEQKRAARDNIYIAAGVVTPAIVARELQANETYPIDNEYVGALESYKVESNGPV